MSQPRLSDFPPNAEFLVEAGDASVTLTVREAQELPGAMREEGGFRLEFVGPAQPILQQATYRFVLDDAAFDIFVVPIAADAQGARYEAIFL